MELGLNGKVALVTGARRGIGAAIRAGLARESDHLCLTARDPAMLPKATQPAVYVDTATFGRLDIVAAKRCDFAINGGAALSL